MPEEMQEEMFCFTLGDGQFYKFTPKHNKQIKECLFQKASVGMASTKIDDDEAEGTKINIPVVVIYNDLYDEDQNQMQEEKLPITEELIFLKYTDGADVEEEAESSIKHGYVFLYPSVNICRVIEFNVTSEQIANELSEFEDWICKVLFIINEQIPLNNSKSKQVISKQLAATSKYCIKCSILVLMQSKDINQIFTG